MSVSPPKKRNKICTSCVLCRRRKVKCDLKTPCTACVRARVSPDQCVYEQNKWTYLVRSPIATLEQQIEQLKRENEELLAGKDAELRAEISQMQAQIDSLQQRLTANPVAAVPDFKDVPLVAFKRESIYAKRTRINFYGPVSFRNNVISHQFVEGVIKPFRELLSSERSEWKRKHRRKRPVLDAMIGFPGLTSNEKLPIFELEVNSKLPPYAVFQERLQYATTRLPVFLPYLPLDKLLLFAEMYFDEDDGKTILKAPVKAGLMSEVALVFGAVRFAAYIGEGFQHMYEDKDDVLYELLVKCLQLSSFLKKQSLPSLYTVIVLYDFAQMNAEQADGGDGSNHVTLAQIAVTMAMQLGLHRDRSKVEFVERGGLEYSPLELASLWARVVDLDAYTSLFVGVPLLITSQNSDAPLDCPNAECIEILREAAQLTGNVSRPPTIREVGGIIERLELELGKYEPYENILQMPPGDRMVMTLLAKLKVTKWHLYLLSYMCRALDTLGNSNSIYIQHYRDSFKKSMIVALLVVQRTYEFSLENSWFVKKLYLSQLVFEFQKITSLSALCVFAAALKQGDIPHFEPPQLAAAESDAFDVSSVEVSGLSGLLTTTLEGMHRTELVPQYAVFIIYNIMVLFRCYMNQKQLVKEGRSEEAVKNAREEFMASIVAEGIELEFYEGLDFELFSGFDFLNEELVG